MPTAAASHVRTHMAAITVAAILNRMVSLFFFFLFVHTSDKNADPVPDFGGFQAVPKNTAVPGKYRPHVRWAYLFTLQRKEK